MRANVPALQKHFDTFSNFLRSRKDSMFSIIIPARNEAQNLPRLLQRLRAMPIQAQIILVDGGSVDETISIARGFDCEIVEGASGRGPQQNAGALRANGEVLWFLHADCLPPLSSTKQIERAIRRGAIGGNFRVRFEANGLAPRTFETIARVQRTRGIYYGDSGIWLTRDAWNALGGFQEWPLFEDFELVRRMEKFGLTACCAGRLLVSARRFEKRPWRVLRLWLELQIRFGFGQAPDELARIYREKSRF